MLFLIFCMHSKNSFTFWPARTCNRLTVVFCFCVDACRNKKHFHLQKVGQYQGRTGHWLARKDMRIDGWTNRRTDGRTWRAHNVRPSVHMSKSLYSSTNESICSKCRRMVYQEAETSSFLISLHISLPGYKYHWSIPVLAGSIPAFAFPLIFCPTKFSFFSFFCRFDPRKAWCTLTPGMLYHLFLVATD